MKHRFHAWVALLWVGCTNDPGPTDSGALDATLTDVVAVPDGGAVDAGVDSNAVPDAPLAATFTLLEGATPLNDYRGVISGPSPNSPTACSYATPTTFAQSLYDVGVRSIRNNDYYDDTLDIDLMFNCSGKTYGSNAACGNEYPCWKGCTLTYPTGCAGLMTYDAGATNGFTSDQRFDSMTDGGFESFFRVGGEFSVVPTYLATGVTARPGKGPQNAEEEANWIEAAKCAASHFSGKQPFPYLNIITETSTHFWSRKWTEFHSFWHKAFAALKSTFGTKFKIGGPGMWGGEWIVNLGKAHENAADCTTATSLPARDFLKTLADYGDKPDWLGFHIFATDATDYPRVIAAVKALLTKSGPCFGAGKPLESPWKNDYFKDAELIVDAFMPSSSALFSQIEPPNVARYSNNKEGAALNASNYIVFQSEGITRAYQYRAGEQGAGGPADGVTKCDAKATPKPRAHVYRFWNRMMEANALQGTVLAPDTTTGLWVMNASAGGKKFVLVSNTSDTASTYTPSWKGSKGILAHTTKSLFTIDDKSDGSKATTLTSNEVKIEARTVQLLELE